MEQSDLRNVRPQVIAHRGASGQLTENSLAAFRRARELGADGVELDVHATSDGVLLVHHDSAVPGLGPIPELTARDLAGYRLANGEALPTLGQALNACQGMDVWVEVKNLPASFDESLLAVLDGGPSPERYGVHGFDHRIVARLGARRPALRRGVLLASYLVDTPTAVKETGAQVVWQECHLIDHALVQALHLAGLALIAWTVNDDAEAIRLTGVGVDALCGNFPERLIKIRQSAVAGITASAS